MRLCRGVARQVSADAEAEEWRSGRAHDCNRRSAGRQTLLQPTRSLALHGCLCASLRPCFTRRNARPASAKLQLRERAARGRANWPASILTIRVRLTFCNTANQPGTLTMQGGALPLSCRQFDGPSSAAHCLAWAVAAAQTANTHARETARATYLSVSATR